MVKLGSISATVVQRVGNKNNGDGVAFAEELCPIEGVEGLLLKLIKSSFKFDDWKHFTYIDTLETNHAFRFVSKIFEDRDCLIKQANNLARHLYEQSIHPNIKIGEFYVVYLEKCEIDGIETNAVGLFKSESRETVLTVRMESNRLVLSSEEGMRLKKWEKGAVVFNVEKENGYKVAVVDNTTSKDDAHYWTDNFLHVEDFHDDYHQTQELSEFCAGYLKQLHEKSVLDCAIAARKTSELLASEGIVEIERLPSLLCETEEQMADFLTYRETYEQDHGPLSSEVKVKPKAVKSKNVMKMNTLRLGSDFEVKVLNSSAHIEKGEEKGKKYYKLYY